LKSAVALDVASREGEPFVEDLPSEVVLRGANTPQQVFVDGKESIFFPDETEDVVAEGVHGNEKRVLGYVASPSSYTTSPWRTIGKVYFTKGGSNYVCSATVLRQFVVATAGHCVYDGAWVTNFIFIPAYYRGSRPYGTFYAYQLFTSPEWYSYGSYCKDYGFAVMQRLNGYGVGDYVGYLGYTYNAGYNLAWRALGYPHVSPFNGEQNYYVDSNIVSTDANCGNRCAPSGCTPNTMRIYYDATGGASGGPWIYNFGGANYFNSVNSYKYTNDPNSMYGPYLDSAWASVLSSASGVVPP
jgi:hypothetical protein